MLHVESTMSTTETSYRGSGNLTSESCNGELGRRVVPHFVNHLRLLYRDIS